MKRLIVRLAVILGIAAHGNAAEFFPPLSVTSPNSSAYYPVGNLCQGPGEGYSATPPHDAVAGQVWVTNQPNGGSGDYYANGVAAPILIIDFGVDRSLTEISTWGYADANANGVRTFDLRFASSAEGPGAFGASIPNQGGFTANLSASSRHSHPLTPVTARYVEFTATDNYRGFGQAGGDRVGLGEIAFEDATPPPDPLVKAPPSVNLELDGSLLTFPLDIQNEGASQALDLTGFAFDGPHAAAFAVVSAPTSIQPGGTQPIVVSFNPSGLTGTIEATLRISSNDATTPITGVVLTGFLHDPRLETGASLDFGIRTPGGALVSRTLTLANRGAGHALAVTGAVLSGADADRFTVISAPSGIPPFGSADVVVQFAPPSGAGDSSSRLTISTNDPANPSTVVTLHARTAILAPGSGVRISEFLAANRSGLTDGGGKRQDWIEIHNPGPGAVDLAGWHLTDRADNLTKWTFPSRVLGENQYLIVFASGQPTPDFIDAGGFLHTNFNLSASGEYLGLVMPDGQTITSEYHPVFPAQFDDVSYGTFVSGGVSANAIATSTPAMLVPPDGTLALTWTQNGFAPGAGWFAGSGQGIGYDTAVDYLPYITTDVKAQLYTARKPGIFIRWPFQVADKSLVTEMSLPVRYDDGFVAYLNGVEIARRNAPASPVWNSLSNGSPALEPGEETIDVSAFVSALQNGDNVLAIHGMNAATNSSDFLIAPELRITTAGNGPTGIGYLTGPTPGAANAGSSVPGPLIEEVLPTPRQPLAGQATLITARVSPRLGPVAGVTLHYRVMFAAEVALPMSDDGTNGDALAGDGLFSAIIPGSAHVAGNMLRWYVSATDDSSNIGRAPAFVLRTGTKQSPEYFGTLIPDPALSSGMPVFQWFTQNVSASHSASGTRASVSFAGRFYDNVYVRQRGGATNGSASQKFDFNKGDSFYIDDSMPSVGEINLNGSGSDSTYVRQPLAFETYRRVGSAACLSALWQMRVNGATDRVGVFVEQVDEDFLTRNGYDPAGDLYKMTSRANLNPGLSDITTGFEKKTGDKTDPTSLGTLVAGLNLPTSAERRRFVIDHLDLPQVVNYLALRSITQDADDVRKNFYVYQDSRGDGRWRVFPWDKDWTFGITGDGGTWLPHPFFGDEEHAKQNANQWNLLYDVMFEETTTQRLYLRRLRTLMDTLLQPASTPESERILENRAAAIVDPASPPLGSDVSSIRNYLNNRRAVLTTNYPGLIPESQPAAPVVEITGAEFNPASGDQDHEYVTLANREAVEIDISGWSLSGGIEFSFPPGTVIERGGLLYVSPDTLAFRQRPSSPSGNEERLVVGPYSGHLSNFGETITLHNSAGAVVGTYTTEAAPSDNQLYLTVSEIMYHPEPDGDAEFVELMNTSAAVTLDLSGVNFSAGIDFTFPAGVTLAPGARILVVRNNAAFVAVHGSGKPVAGLFTAPSSLDNEGDTLRLDDADGSTICEISYDDVAPWPAAADGSASLVLIAPKTRPDPSLAQNWRASMTASGNPGSTDAIAFVGDPSADSDQDSWPDLIEYALGANPQITVTRNVEGLTLTMPRVPNADDALIGAEVCTDLVHWVAAEVIATAANTISFRAPAAMNTAGRCFMRAAVRLKEGGP